MMMQEMTIEQAIAASDKAIAESGFHANKDWRRKALDVVLDLCKLRREFTADDVWEQLEKTGWRTHEPRAMGAVLREASVNGFCSVTPMHTVSRRKTNHRRPIPVWKSMLFRENGA